MRTEIYPCYTDKFRVNHMYDLGRYANSGKNSPFVKILTAMSKNGFLTKRELLSVAGYKVKANGYGEKESALCAICAYGAAKMFRNGRHVEYQITSKGQDLLDSFLQA